MPTEQDEVIAFKQNRQGWTPATNADKVACQNYGLRTLFASETQARNAVERIGCVFQVFGQDDKPTPASTPKRTKEVTVASFALPRIPFTEPDALARLEDDGAPLPEMLGARMPAFKHATREAWLLAAVDALRPMFRDVGRALPDKLRVSCGWPLGSRKFIGQAFNHTASADGHNEIFISPKIAKPLGKPKTECGVLCILVHELCHAALPAKTGHKKAFQKLAASVGLQAPWTATTCTEEGIAALEPIAKALGAYPHGAMIDDARKKQTTRLLKCQCAVCGYTVRITGKWLADVGAPHCPDHGEMLEC